MKALESMFAQRKRSVQPGRSNQAKNGDLFALHRSLRFLFSLLFSLPHNIATGKHFEPRAHGHCHL